MAIIKGSRVTIRTTRWADLTAMAAWRPFNDPLHLSLNWRQKSPERLTAWFRRYTTDPSRRSFTVLDEHGQVIGSLTLREVEGRRSARLGITMGADFIDQGYGSEALFCFLDFYFNKLDCAKIVLDVAGVNQRAIRVYEKLGFTKTGQFERAAEQSQSLKEDPVLGQFYRRDWLGHWWLLFYEMELSQRHWQRQTAHTKVG